MSKIRGERIEFKNFFSYGNSWHTVDLHEGLNVVLGHDADKDRSNGSGKTSFLEAIPFALFGQTGKGVPLGKIVNWKNGKQCEVRFHFEKDGIKYEIQRGIKPGVIELIKDGVKVPKLSDKRMFQQELETDLIGMDFRAAQAIHFQNANNMISMFNTPKAEKRKFIEKFFNLEIYSKMNEHVNAKLRAIEQKRSELDSEKTFKERRITELQMEIDGCGAPDIASYEQAVVSAEKTLDMFRTEHHNILSMDSDELTAKQVICDELVTEKKKELAEVTAAKRSIELEIRALDTEIGLLDARIVEIGDISEQKEKLAKLKAGLETIGDLDGECGESRKKIATIQERLHATLACNSNVKDKIVTAENNLKKWKGTAVLDTAECPTCFQEADAEHIKGHIDEQIKIYTDEIAELNISLSEGQVIAGRIEGELEDEKSVLQKAEDRNAKKVVIERKIAEYSTVNEKELELKTINEKLVVDSEKLVKFHDELEVTSNNEDDKRAELISIEADVVKVRDTLNLYNRNVAEAARLEATLESEKKILASQKEIAARIEGEQAARIASRDQMQTELSEWGKKYEKLDTMKDYMAYIKESLKDENVKQYAISNIVPFVQMQTNHYLSETGHNYYIELDAWLDGEIKGFGVGDSEFGNMSGGEGKSIDLALKFAMMDVARRQAGSYIDVLVLDELLDSSIDAFGLEKTVDIVKLKQREDALKVFVVSHREEIGMFDFDRTYNVVKENGFSSISVS